jgi:hypothetical protein
MRYRTIPCGAAHIKNVNSLNAVKANALYFCRENVGSVGPEFSKMLIMKPWQLAKRGRSVVSHGFFPFLIGTCSPRFDFD